jgi:iron complex outermembrane receptor protein
LIEIPQSISVISREQLDEQNVQSLSQALVYTAGVSVNGTGTDTRYDWPLIRGFSATTYGMYLDGLRWMPNQLSGRFDPYGLESIDVLKGPASVLYGQGTPGGLIDMVSKKPTAEAFHEVQLEYGSFDHRQIKAELSGPLGGSSGAEGQWLYRVTALAHDNLTQVDFTSDKRVFIAPAATWRPVDGTQLTLLGSYQHDSLGSFYPFLPARGTVLPNPNGAIGTGFFSGDTDFNTYSRTQYALGYLFSTHLGDAWTLRQNFRYNRFQLGNWEQMYGVLLEPDLRTLRRFPFASRGNDDSYAVDNQAQGHWVTGLLEQTALLGLDYQSQSLSQRQVAISNLAQTVPIDIFDPVYNQPVPALAPTVDSGQKAHQLGVYLQDQIKIDQRWVVLLGGRTDWADTTTHNRLLGRSTTQDDHEFSGRAGVLYLTDIGIAPYASYSQSFLPSSGTDFSGVALKPVTGTQYEAGVRYQPKGSSSYISVSAYDIREHNVAETDPDHPGFSIQTGEIRSRGVEVEGSVEVIDGLNVRFAYTADPVRTIESVVPGAIGQRPTVTPEHMSSLWANYVVPLGELSGFGVGAGVRYVGNSYGGIHAPNPQEPRQVVPFYAASFTLADAALHYDWRQMRFAVNAANVFDRIYVAGCYSATGCSYGDRRSIIGSVRYQW